MHIQNTVTFCLFRFVAVATVTAYFLTTSCLARPQEITNDVKGRIADKILNALVEANGVPGMAAAVTLDGEVIWSGVAGYRDVSQGAPVDDNTIFRLASVSKLITVGAAARL